MGENKYKVTVEIYGEFYALKGDVEPGQIEEIAALLDSRMKQIAKGNSRLSTAKIAVLAGLNIAEEYRKLEKDYQQLLAMVKGK